MHVKKRFPILCGRSGFTLLELLVTLAIAAVLAAVVLGGASALVPRSQVKSAAQKLRADLQQAKMEAVKNNRECLVTFTEANGTQGSYQACFDNNDDDVCNEDDGDEILAQIDLADDDYKHAELSNAAFTNGTHFRFNARGMPLNDTGGWSAGTVGITLSNDASYSLSIILSPTGRIRIE